MTDYWHPVGVCPFCEADVPLCPTCECCHDCCLCDRDFKSPDKWQRPKQLLRALDALPLFAKELVS